MTEFFASLDWLLIGLTLAAGMILGGLYLFGLWWTVRQVTTTGKRSLLLLSFVVRAGLLLTGLWYLSTFGTQALIASLLGFLLARWIVTRIVGTGVEPA